MRMKKFLSVLVAGLLFANSALAAKAPKHFVDAAKLPFAEIAGVPTQRYWGMIDGAGYRIEIPENWNGSLVLWAHGYRGTGLELSVDNHPLRTFLVANGYAWAASSYRKNGYDALGAAKDTHVLRSHFIERFGRPTRMYITGASLGGHVTALIAERWPAAYSGAMSLCGWLGDAEQFDFYLDFNAAAQTLSGVGESYPYESDYLTSTVPATKAALGAAFPFVLNAPGQQLKGLTQLRSGGVRPVFDQGWLYWNSVAGDFLLGLGVNSLVEVENAGVTYQFDTNPALSTAETLFNAAVQRVTANAKLRANVTPTTGNLGIPMLTLHTIGDLFAPLLSEQVYAQRAALHGKSNLLVQRATRDFGHCTFTPTEITTGFTDLVNWVEGGDAPDGDNVLDAATVAHPEFGCTFTDLAAPRIWDTAGLGFLAPPACPTP